MIMKEANNRSVFIGLKEIAGFYSHLNKGLQELGIKSTFICLTSHPFQYGGDEIPNIFVAFCKKISNKSTNSIFLGALKILFIQICKIPIFIWSIIHFKTFIFSQGESFFYLIDLPILKILRKNIIFLFHGSEIRPPYIGGYYQYKNLSRRCLNLLTYFYKIRVYLSELFVNTIISHPGYGQFHSKRFIKFLIIGIPIPHTFHDIEKRKKNNQINILHSPSNPLQKGTPIIREVIRDLKNKGYNFSYTEISGRPHSEVLTCLNKCDFVIDQLYSDTPMAGFAAEAAAFGKPSIVCGYYSDYIRNDFREEDIPPSFFCHPDNLESAIIKFLTDESFRIDLGRKAADFVYTRWNIKEVGNRFLQIIDGDIPESWYYSPKNNLYIGGAGLADKQIKRNISLLIKQYGKKSLRLSDKPELEHMFIESLSNFSLEQIDD